jgi:protein subunit release factor B
VGFEYRLFKAKDEARNSIGAKISDFEVQDQLISLGLAYPILPNVSLGATGKMIGNKVQDKSVSTFSFDGGVLAKLGSNWSAALAIQNLGSGKALESQKDPLPMVVRSGLTYQTPRWLISADISSGRDSITRTSGGFEWAFNPFLRFRGGAYHATTLEFSGGLGLMINGPRKSTRSENRSSAGVRNISFEVTGKNAYGNLKYENGVHRLVRISPFNAQGKRQTSFSMVEVVPQLTESDEVELKESDVDIVFAKAGGPGGQNVNKRETAVRATHRPTGFTVHVTTERSQAQNKEKALEMLRGKLFKKQEEDRTRAARGLALSSTTAIEWGNQIRSYVLHPYQMVKDHRTEHEVRDIEKVFGGDVQSFIDAAHSLDNAEHGV